MVCFENIILALLSILPWQFFLFRPFRDSTRYSFKITVLLVGSITVLCNIVLAVVYMQEMLIVVKGFEFQMLAFAISLTLAFIFIEENKYKIIFVFLMIIPGTLVTIVVSNFFAQSFENQLMGTIFIRIVATSIVCCLFTLFWEKYFVIPTPYVNDKDKELWKYAWFVPSILVSICLGIYWAETALDKIDFIDVILQIGIFLSTMLICLLLFNCLRYARKEISMRSEDEKLKFLLDLQKKNYQEILLDFDRIKKNNHDFRHHLMTISAYATKKENDKLIDYIKNLTNITNEYQQHFFCENMTINAILVSNYKKAEDSNIEINVKLSIPEGLNLSDVDLSMLIGNLIENAIEASLFLPEDRRKIQIKGKLISDKLYIIIENNHVKKQVAENGTLFSSKRNYHSQGIGLYTVRTIVDKYFGEIDINYDDDVFVVKIVLTVPEK